MTKLPPDPAAFADDPFMSDAVPGQVVCHVFTRDARHAVDCSCSEHVPNAVWTAMVILNVDRLPPKHYSCTAKACMSLMKQYLEQGTKRCLLLYYSLLPGTNAPVASRAGYRQGRAHRKFSADGHILPRCCFVI